MGLGSVYDGLAYKRGDSGFINRKQKSDAMIIKIANLADLERLNMLRLEFNLFEQKYIPGFKIDPNDKSFEKNLKKETKEFLEKNNPKILICKDKDKTLGYLSFFVYPEFKTKIFIGELYVYHSARRKGIGKLLLQFLIEWARKNRRKILHLNVSKLNKEALNLFKKIGFKEISTNYISLEKII